MTRSSDTHKEYLQDRLGLKILSVTSVSGGDIADAFRIVTASGRLFCKFMPGVSGADAIQKEAMGLKMISDVVPPNVPAIIDYLTDNSGGYLVMDYIEQGTASDPHALGKALATLHSTAHDEHGLENDNYIGRLKQVNTPASFWPAFWSVSRLRPQLVLATTTLHPSMLSRLHALDSQLPELLPNATPVALHGDLWSGNVIWDGQGAPYFIDPSFYYGHREVDLAMMALFGGFSKQVIQSYETYLPLESGWQARQPIYQLYYALVHVNLFGSGYVSLVDRLLSEARF